MTVLTDAVTLATQGHADIHRITDEVAVAVARSGIRNGAVTIFTPSATSAVTTLEWEPGCLVDLRRFFDEVATPDRVYQHNINNGDGNGHAHVRAAFVGPSLTVPIVEGTLVLGIWQQIVFVDFDNRPRERRLVVQMIGE
jgi:secondary thiamine-phosphate synthase enzyme